MSISSIGSYGGNSYVNSLQQRRKEEMDAISDAVKSGDISAAQQALKTFKSDTASDTSSGEGVSAVDKARKHLASIDLTATSDSSASGTTSSPKDQIDALFSAIESGDLSGAQSALSSLQANMPKPPEMGPPGGAGDTSETAKSLDALFEAVQSGDSTKAQAALATIEQQGGLSSTDGDGNQIDKDLEALFTAVKSGDMKTAQSSLDTLTQDMQSMGPPPGPPPGMGPMGGPPPGMGGTGSSDTASGMQSMLDQLSSVFDAVEKGDITSAQQLVTALRTASTGASSAATATSSYLDQTTT